MKFTSEQVSCGHPDKICDQISDAFLTDCLRHDRNSRVAIECMIKDYEIVLAGEITTAYEPNYYTISQSVLSRIGLSDTERYRITRLVSRQSPDIAIGVDHGGAGDQGMMFGYATDETPEMLPLPFAVATRALELLRDLKCPLLLPDAKTQVTYDYARGRIDTFLISTQHREEADLRDVRNIVHAVMEAAADDYSLKSFGDTGLTGRKIIADTYGGMCRHGGGAFSGKDPTKVDRSGAYMARKIAKDVIREALAKRCEIQLSYAIGVAEPVSIAVDCFGTNNVPPSEIIRRIKKRYDLTPGGIIRDLKLLDVDYNTVSAYGHFGKDGLPWEQ